MTKSSPATIPLALVTGITGDRTLSVKTQLFALLKWLDLLVQQV
ncbi:hypothetical protein [Phormidium nigroviride]